MLEYKAYKPRAEAKVKQIADEIRTHWETVEKIAIVQQIGWLNPRTRNVVIACTCEHRDMCVFEAARFDFDRLKEIVPFWKKKLVSQMKKGWEESTFQSRLGENEYTMIKQPKRIYRKPASIRADGIRGQFKRSAAIRGIFRL
jgi:molybdopterin synthase catalytic subunit